MFVNDKTRMTRNKTEIVFCNRFDHINKGGFFLLSMRRGQAGNADMPMPAV